MIIYNVTPPEGIPLAVEVEVKTRRTIGFALRFPLSGGPQCPDAKVAIVEDKKENPRVLGIANVTTSTVGLCTGSTIVQLPADFRPDINDRVKILVYESTVTDQQILNGLLPVWESQPIQIGISEQIARQVGQIAKANTASLFNAPFLKDFNTTLANVGKLAVGGLLLYLVFINRDSAKAVANRISNQLKT